MRNFSNELTDAQLERLAILSEEMGEAQQVIGKIIRHGYASYNPMLEQPSRSNREELARELGHVHFAIDTLVIFNDDVDSDKVSLSYVEKEKSIKQWLHYQEPPR
jgi:hypothetical protein